MVGKGLRNEPIATRRKSFLRLLWPFGHGRNRRTRTTPLPSVRSPGGATGPAATVKRSSRDRQRARRDLRSLGRLVGLLACIGLLVGGGWGLRRWLTRSPHFAVREIRVSPTRHVSADALRARSGVELGDNLFRVDLAAAARDVQQEPWVARVEVRRELPSVIAIDVVEREPACVVALGSLYLADANGEVFKRAGLDDTSDLPVVTGVPRDGYVDDREASQALIRDGLAALALWNEQLPDGTHRPAIGEVHVDAAVGATLFANTGGAAVRLGRGTPDELRERLRRVDAVTSALAASHDKAQLIYVDQRSRSDRVTVALASK